MGLFVSIYDGETGTGAENRLHYWLRFDKWSVVEASLILCDLDPDLTRYEKNVENIEQAGDFAGRLIRDPWSTELDEASKRVRDVLRIWWSGERDDESLSPAEWIAWARGKKLHIPWLQWAEKSRLLPALPSSPVPVSKTDHPTPVTSSDSMTTLERKSLLTLVITMAIKGYKYDPTANRNTTASDIATDAAELGLTLSDDTIRKYLSQGAALVEPRRK